MPSELHVERSEYGQPIVVENEASRNSLPLRLRDVCITRGRRHAGDGKGGIWVYAEGEWLALK